MLKIKENPTEYLKKFALLLLVFSMFVKTFQIAIYYVHEFLSMEDVFMHLLDLVPIVLFVICMKQYDEIVKSKILLSMVFIIMAIHDLVVVIDMIKSIFLVMKDAPIEKYTWDILVDYGIINDLRVVVLPVICILLALFLAYDCGTDFKKCKISRVCAFIMIIYPLKEMVDLVFSIWVYQPLYFPMLLQAIITVLWHIVIILFLFLAIKPKANAKKTLKKLKDQYEAGTISEEVYTQKKEEILKTL